MKKNKIIEQRLSEYFEKEQVSARETFNQLSLFIYSIEDSSSDLYHLARLMSDEVLKNVINFYDGATLRVPTKEKFKESLLLALLYYLYEIKKLRWPEIKELLEFDRHFKDYSVISLGKKLIKIKKVISREQSTLLKNMDLVTVITEVIK